MSIKVRSLMIETDIFVIHCLTLKTKQATKQLRLNKLKKQQQILTHLSPDLVAAVKANIKIVEINIILKMTDNCKKGETDMYVRVRQSDLNFVDMLTC